MKIWAIYESNATTAAAFGRFTAGTFDMARPENAPHCSHAIDEQTWNKQIIPAYCAMYDANLELLKDHTGYHTPLFEVSYESATLFKDSEGKKTVFHEDD